MTMLIIQSLLLLAIAYILGCVAGCILHRMFGAKDFTDPVLTSSTAAVARKHEPAPARASKAKPKSTPAKKVSAPRKFAAGKKDDLKRIKGIGRQNEAKLNEIGIATFEEIAGWSAKDQSEIGERLAFPGRIEREDWVKQAQKLAEGSKVDFSKRSAKGEVASSTGKSGNTSQGRKPSTLSKPKSGGKDKLTEIDGVGPALEKKLNALGIYHFDQIAGWSGDHQEWIGIELGFPGRPEREKWATEAKKLAKGGAPKRTRKAARGEIVIKRKPKK